MELFGDWVKDEWMEEIFGKIQEYPQHTFIFLTKCPENLHRWSPFPANAYIGVSVTNQEQYDDAVKYLKVVDATVKFLSFEPLLEYIKMEVKIASELKNAGISWVIAGLQTPYSLKTAPKLSEVYGIIEAADRASIPVFLKNNLKPLLGENLRQEMPRERRGPWRNSGWCI